MPFPTFDKQADIPKGFEGEYEERDGKWVAKLPDVAKLEETLGKVRGEKKDAEKLAREAADRAADLQRKLDAKEATGAETDKKVSDMLAKWEKDKDAAVKAVQDKLDEANGKLRSVNLDDKAKAAFLKAGGRPERADAALKLKRDILDLADERIVIKNEKGEVTTATVEDLWGKDFRKEMPDFYTGTKATGGNAPGGGTNGSTGAADADLLAHPERLIEAANTK